MFVRWLILALCLAPLSAQAQVSKPLWEFGLGMAVLDFPDYRGADQGDSYLLPLPTLIYRGERLKVDREGIRGLLFRSERVTLDISLDGAVPVDSDRNGARRGMPSLDPVFEIGPSLDITLADSASHRLKLRLPLRGVFAANFGHLRDHGWLFYPHLKLDNSSKWQPTLLLGPLYASDRYHDYYYSVAPPFATAERPAYSANAGYSGTRLNLSVSRHFNGLWLGAFLRYDDLRQAVFEDSPLFKREHALMLGMGISWFFAQSTHKVPVDE